MKDSAHIAEISQYRILLVEDQDPLADILVSVLVGENYQVKVVHDGKLALKAIDDSEWNLLITDLSLPNISGLDVLAHFTEVFPYGEAIIITGFATMESAVRAIELGANAYMIKPFHIKQFKLIVQRTLEKISIKEENRKLLNELTERNEQLSDSLNTLNTTQRKLIEKERLAAIGELMVTFNHGFKNAIGGIVGSLNVLKTETTLSPLPESDITSSEAESVLNAINLKALELLDMINQVNQLTKARSIEYINDISMIDLRCKEKDD